MALERRLHMKRQVDDLHGARFGRAKHLLFVLSLTLVTLPDFHSASHAAITGRDFEGGTFQGWTKVSTSRAGPTNDIAVTDNDVCATTTWRPLGSRTEGVGTMAAVGPFGVRDSAYDAPHVFRSPTSRAGDKLNDPKSLINVTQQSTVKHSYDA
jgi:hypothetical protein